MEVCFGKPDDIEHRMSLVRRVSRNFPGLETERDLEEHRQTVPKFMEKRQALCVKADISEGQIFFHKIANDYCHPVPGSVSNGVRRETPPDRKERMKPTRQEE